MQPKILIVTIALLLLAPISWAADSYKPYMHKATVPEHPKIKLFGQYETNLFPGAATYTYPIEVPKGTNNLQPSIAISYNSHTVKQRPGILGAGWSLTSNYIYRDINTTPDDSTDDKFILLLEGASYELIHSNNQWHTEVEDNFKIENLSEGSNNYWLLTKKDGTRYRFGYNADSELSSNMGKSYSLKYSLDQIQDTYGNKIYYTYLENPFANDQGAVYIDKIEYNNDEKRRIQFAYETKTRPDTRLVFEQGNKLEESRRLADIYIFANNNLVRRYNLTYTRLSPALTAISNITDYGSDNTSIYYSVSFNYYKPSNNYTNHTKLWKIPTYFSDDDHKDYGVRVEDVNNDGLADIVRGYDTINKVWLNNGSNWTLSSWKLPFFITDGNGKDMGIRFADVNGDGYIDILRAVNGVRNVSLNNKSGWSSNSIKIPLNFVTSEGKDLGVRFADVNGDGYIDILRAVNGVRNVSLNNKSGWSSNSIKIPDDFVTAATGDDVGVRLLDLNGDGLSDILKGRDSIRMAWLNNGSGFVNYTSIWKPPVDLANTGYTDSGVRFADINGDGAIDILEDFKNTSTIIRRAWLNNGSGWHLNNSWSSPEPFTSNGYSYGRRIADLDGDGLVDILVAQDSNSPFRYTLIRNSTLPYLVNVITNEFGGITTIDYAKSTSFNNSENGTSDMGFNLFVVRNITVNNSINNPLDFSVFSATSYNYSYGKYDYEKADFRGFKKVIESKPYAIVNHTFYQDTPRKGKEYKTEIFDKQGNLYSKNIKQYVFVHSKGIYNVTLKYSADYLYDSSDNPKITNTSYTYDTHQNPITVYEYGDINTAGDEKTTNYSYAYNTDGWIVDKVASVTVYDENNNKAKKTKYFYDDLGFKGMGDKGALTRVERWNDNGNNSFTHFGYDVYGNLISETDSLGHTTKYVYDAANTYLTAAINALGHITFYEYDLGTGNLNWQEKNGIRTNFEYEVFGRISKEIRPYDFSLSPTKSYNYDFDGVAPESISVSLKMTANKTQDVEYFYDGFANLIQLKTEAENGKQIIKNLFYDDAYRISSEQNPYYNRSSGLANVSSAGITYYSYDALDRVIGILNPDSTTKNITFNRYNITDYDENNNSHKYELDAYGRIIKVSEYNTNDVNVKEIYNTTYEYDANDNLIKITDNEGNVFSFAYDSLNRKIAMDDPDLGSWAYKYDTNGNLIKQTNNRNEIITLKYDALNRIILKDSDDVDTAFIYDLDYYGTLSSIAMGNESISYNYDDRLRVIKETSTMNGVDFATDFLYDSQDRIISQEGLSEIDYISNREGKIKEIFGYVNNSAYNAFGSVLNRTYANDLIQSFTYDTENNRLTQITIPNIQSLAYTYDDVGNILTINDAVQDKLHKMSYDNLDRLTASNISSDRYVYSYNSIGNIMKIVKNNESKKFVYRGNQSHAPSKIIQGGAGIDVYGPKETGAGKTRTITFYLVNDKYTTLTGVNLTVKYGDGNTFSNTSNIVADYIKITLPHTYTYGGDYGVNITAWSTGINDTQTLPIKFGTRAHDLKVTATNISKKSIQFQIKNDLNVAINGISWNCSDGQASGSPINLAANQIYYLNLTHSYSFPGDKTFSCSATSLDGDETKTISFTIKGFEIENYGMLTSNTSKRIIGYDVVNHFNPVEANTSMSSEQQSFSRLINLTRDEKVMVFAEFDYSADGIKSFEINVTSTNYSQEYIESTRLTGVSIENYSRKDNGTTKMISFNLRNDWHDGTVNYTISDPPITNSINLTYNQTTKITINHNYTTQGKKQINVTAKISLFIDQIQDFFEIRPLRLESFIALTESKTDTISELVINNNQSTAYPVSWTLNTGYENLTSSEPINISKNLFIYIASNYTSEGVYKTKAIINASTFDDNQTGVVVT